MELDGKNPSLSETESISLFNGLNSEFTLNYEKLTSTFFLLSSSNELKQMLPIFQLYNRKSSLTKVIGLLFLKYKVDYSFPSDKMLIHFLKQVEKVNFGRLLENHYSFRVKLIRKGDLRGTPFINAIFRNQLKISTGKTIYKLSNCAVNIKDPFYEIELYIISGYLILGLKLFESNKKSIIKRSPSNRYYFHSASMNPLLIHAMINLTLSVYDTNLNSKPIFLDPFMGGGGMLIEAGSLGYHVIGIDIGYWMCRGSRMNLMDVSTHGLDEFPWTILRANSSFIPLMDNCIDSIVTDPPYGVSTSLKEDNLEDLLHIVLQECFRVLKKGRRMAISIPSTIQIDFHNFKVINKLYDRVHKSLTRVIHLLEKPEVYD